MAALTGGLVATIAATGCGATATAEMPSQADQRDLAGRFAAALLSGDTAHAHAMLDPHSDDGALTFLVHQATAGPASQRASIRLPARHAGNRWTFGYVRRRTYPDLRFETERGDLLVFVTASRTGASVYFFAFNNVHRRFSTHHDSQLLPSNR